MKIFSTAIAFCLLASATLTWAQGPGGQRPGQRGGQRGGQRQGDGRRGQNGPQGGRGQQGGQRGPTGAGGAAMQSPVMRIFDADGDGKISAAEIRNASKALAKLDTNKDGDITAEEMPAGRRGGPQQAGGMRNGGQGANGGRGQAGRGPGGQGARAGGGGPQGAGPGGQQRGPRGDGEFIETLMSADADNDGMLTADELPPHMHAAHGRADANKDGKLNEQEMTTFVAEFQRNKLRPEGDAPVNRPTNGQRR